MRIVLTLSLLATLVLAGCSSPSASVQTPPAETPDVPTVSPDDGISAAAVSGGAGGTGGRVKDSVATFGAIALDRSTGDNSGSTQVVVSGVVIDKNAEDDIATIRATLTGPNSTLVAAEHAVTPAERNATTEPASFAASGCKVWTGTLNDGSMDYKCRLTIAAFLASGTYTATARATSPQNVQAISGAGPTFTVTRFSLVSVASAPVNAAGVAQTGANWGEWEAFPGDTNVVAANYIKITNDGDTPNAAIIIDFTEAAFGGSSDASFSVPIDGNVQFAFFEDTTPATTSPSEGAFNFGTASGVGSTTVTFTGQGNVIYVAYRIVQLPSILKAQSYGATFTVTEL